jgi:hypothetical protein
MNERLLKKFLLHKVEIWMVGDTEKWIGELKMIDDGVLRLAAQYGGRIYFLDCDSIVAISEVL